VGVGSLEQASKKGEGEYCDIKNHVDCDLGPFSRGFLDGASGVNPQT